MHNIQVNSRELVSWLLKNALRSRKSDTRSICQVCVTQTHLGRKVSHGLELFEDGGQEERGEKEDDRPEEDVRDEGTAVAAGRADELSV